MRPNRSLIFHGHKMRPKVYTRPTPSSSSRSQCQAETEVKPQILQRSPRQLRELQNVQPSSSKLAEEKSPEKFVAIETVEETTVVEVATSPDRLNQYMCYLRDTMAALEQNEQSGEPMDMELLAEAVHLSNQVLKMQGGAELITSSPSSYIEKHRLTGSDEVLRFAVGRNVILHVESQPRVRDSARANTQTLSDYKWENKANYAGRILSARDKLVAYRLFNETTGEAVRVLEREQRCRHLIKDFRQPPVDLQWAVHTPLLAVLDANANIYIYAVDENGQKLSKYLIIIQEGDHTADGPARLVWCPYIPDEDTETGRWGERDEVHLLGVIQGSQVNLFMLNKIKEEIGRTEVTYERVRELKGGMLTIQMDSEITACRISPDATALAAATANGELRFYVMEEWDNLQLANKLPPLLNSPIEELVFLDNLTAHNHDEQFWKYVVITTDNGRRLTLYDCDNWRCIAKLRFESPNQVNRMELLVEPSMQYLFVADYDASNLFCIELSQQLQPNAPNSLCFAACTQITFCNPLISVVPCALVEHYESGGELSLEDEDQGLGGSASNSSAVASLVAITQRSLLELNVELDRVFTVDPSVATAAAAVPTTAPAAANPQSAAPRTIGDILGLTTQKSSSSPKESSTDSMPMAMPPPPPQPSAEFLQLSQQHKQHHQEQRLDDYDPLAQLLGGGSGKNNTKEELPVNSSYATANPAPNQNMNNFNMGAAATGEMAEKLADILEEKFGDLIEQRFGELTEKVDELSLHLRNLQEENEQLRASQADNLSNVLEKISNELKQREERTEATVLKQGKESAEKVMRTLESQLLQHAVSVQRSVDLAQTRHSEQMHLSLERSVVPQVEVFCTQLFTQLNEQFQKGLAEFMEQLKAISHQQQAQFQAVAAQIQAVAAAAAQPPPQPPMDPMEKMQRMLGSNQFNHALQFALECHQTGADPDQKLLLAACKHIDPDAFFNVANCSGAGSPTAVPPPPLPVPVLLQLLLQLAERLDSETELRFRYLENALLAVSNVNMASRQAAVNAKAAGSGEPLRKVMERLGHALSAIAEKDISRECKRQIRIMNQLVANLLAAR